MSIEDAILNTWQDKTCVVSICCLSYNHESYIERMSRKYPFAENRFWIRSINPRRCLFGWNTDDNKEIQSTVPQYYKANITDGKPTFENKVRHESQI